MSAHSGLPSRCCCADKYLNTSVPMAKAHLNSAFGGFSGRSGNMVYRSVRGQTFISQRPLAKSNRVSAAQKSQRDRFMLAGAYAKQVLADACQRRVYEDLAKARNRRADKLLTSDFLTPPIVEEINVSDYRRHAGELIRVLATDDIEVVAVAVAIRTAAGALVEQGAATKTHGVWCYRTASAAPADVALTITATARDRPGHDGTLTIVLT
jgi:hypothetical protein